MFFGFRFFKIILKYIKMKMLKFTVVLIVLTLFSFSCYVRKPVSRTIPENNPSYEVDFLFEHDGCKVYRFYDRGNYVYFTNCCGDVNTF
jgi:hypothetical protein